MERENGNARELAYRESDGLEVSLLWDPTEDALTVVVTDWRTGDGFDFAPDRSRALDAFYHPFAARGVEDNLPRLRQLGIGVVPPPAGG